MARRKAPRKRTRRNETPIELVGGGILKFIADTVWFALFGWWH
jgi:hypothetical protein